MMMKHTRDGTVEGTAKHTAGQVRTHSLSLTQINTLCTYIHITDTHTYTKTHTHSQQGALGRVRLVLSARDRHVDSIHHT